MLISREINNKKEEVLKRFSSFNERRLAEWVFDYCITIAEAEEVKQANKVLELDLVKITQEGAERYGTRKNLRNKNKKVHKR